MKAWNDEISSSSDSDIDSFINMPLHNLKKYDKGQKVQHKPKNQFVSAFSKDSEMQDDIMEICDQIDSNMNLNYY